MRDTLAGLVLTHERSQLLASATQPRASRPLALAAGLRSSKGGFWKDVCASGACLFRALSRQPAPPA